MGACTRTVKCTDCHDPHAAGPSEGVPVGGDNPAHIEACLTCHEQYQNKSAQIAHSRHPEQSGVTCLDCHMPRMTQGLAHVTRTHRISSPTDAGMLEQAAPNACNLCHLDRPLQWTLDQLAAGWGVSIEAEASWTEAYAERMDGPVGEAWLQHRIPQVRLVAADAYSRSPLGTAPLPQVIGTLNDDYAVNRTFGLFAVERILGRRLSAEEYRLYADPAIRSAQVEALLPVLQEAVPGGPGEEAVGP